MNVRKMILAVLCMVSVLPALAQSKIEFFHGTWVDALKKAEAEHKLVFMDAYTDWCGPCKWMSANVFTDPAVATYFNANFVNVKMDMEKGEGIELAKRYEVMAYPTLLMIRADGQTHGMAVGAKKAEDFLAWAKSVTDPAYVSPEDIKRDIMEKGNRDPETMRDYVLAQIEAGSMPDDVFELYRPHMQGEELFKPDNFKILRAQSYDVDAAEVQFLLANHERFSKAFPDVNIGLMLVYCHVASSVSAAYNGDMERAEEVLLRLEKLSFPEVKCQALITRAELKKVEGDIAGYVAYRDQAFSEGEFSWDELNGVGYQVATETDDSKLLKTCLSWLDRSIEMDANTYNLDSKAFILYKLGKKKEAVKVMREAIAVGKDAGEDVSASQQMLDEWLAN